MSKIRNVLCFAQSVLNAWVFLIEMGRKGLEGGKYGTMTYSKQGEVQSYGECAVEISLVNNY